MPALETIKLRRGTAATWTSTNPVLAQGEPGLETDTGYLKIGDGSTHWTTLKYTAQPGAYANVSQARPGNRCVFLGDSTTRFSTDDPPIGGLTDVNIYAAWPSVACWASKQQLLYVKNAGVTGDTSAQMVARFAADVAAYSPTVVTILAGRNDVATAVTEATWQANIKALVKAVQGINAVPVLCTMLPCSDNSGYRQKIATWNKWLRRYAAANGIFLLDFYAQAVDPTTGGYLASYASPDGIHPGEAGYVLLGQYVNTALATVLPPYSPTFAREGTTDTDNLFPDPLLQGGNTGGLNNNFGWTTAPVGASASIVTDAAVPGNMQRISTSATGTISNGNWGMGDGAVVSPGDVLAFSCVVTNAGTGEAAISMGFGAGADHTIFRCNAAITRAYLYYEVTVPAATTQIQMWFAKQNGTGNLDFGQISIVNLTKLGILNP